MGDTNSWRVGELFLGLLTGLFWFLLAVLGVVEQFFTLVGAGAGLGSIVAVILAVVGFIVILLFGYLILRTVWDRVF